MKKAVCHLRYGTLIALIGLFSAGLFAQAGRNDSSFVPSGLTNVTEFDGVVSCLAIQSDGKVLTAGNFLNFNGIAKNRIARLNVNGDLDPGFDIGTGLDGTVYALALQTDGKVIVGGLFSNYNGIPRTRIARLNPNGSLDNSFDPGTAFDGGVVYSLAIQPDGKIIAGGELPGISPNRLVRLNTNGSTDPTFNTGTGMTWGRIQALAVQPDGKIVVGGLFFSFNGQSHASLFRVLANGSLDGSFNTGSLFSNARVRTLLLSPDGKIYVGGNLPAEPGGNQPHLTRLLSNGIRDASFHSHAGFNFYVYGLALQPDGKLLVGGGFSSYQGVSRRQVARLYPNGNLDVSLVSYMGSAGAVECVALQPNGNVVVGGSFDECNLTAQNKIARLLPNGNMDLGFHARLANEFAGFDNTARALAIQTDGKIIIGGEFNAFCNIPNRGLVRLLPDGSLDNTFNLGAGVDHNVHVVALQPDGKIIIGGKFRLVDNVSRNRIARLNPDGSLDLTFDPASGFDGLVNEVNAVAIQPDGKIIVAGWFEAIQGHPRSMIARLHSTGALDLTFDPGPGFDNIVRSLALQPDGKVVAGGWFNFFNGISRNGVARLNADGSLDGTFNIGTGFNNYIYTVALQPDGKVIVGGCYNSFNGLPQPAIARLNPDGSLDATFNIGTGIAHAAYYGGAQIVSVQPDGSILVGGDYETFNGVSRNRLARLYPDGSLDQSFVTGSGFGNYSLLAIAAQPDEKIVIAGNFSDYNGVIRYHIIRILNTLPVPLPAELQSFQGYPANGAVVINWTTSREQNTAYFSLERSRNKDYFEEIGRVAAAGNTANAQEYQFIDQNALAGESFYRLRTVDMDGSYHYSRLVNVQLQAEAALVLGRVFPNPATNELYVELSLPVSGNLQIGLSGLDGRTVWVRSEKLEAGFHCRLLDLSNLASGIYLLELQQNGQHVFCKVVKR